jgi:hypothetical protein
LTWEFYFQGFVERFIFYSWVVTQLWKNNKEKHIIQVTSRPLNFNKNQAIRVTPIPIREKKREEEWEKKC